jgi:pimeloyl-ACP methyl ester carboxylesterase
MNAERFWMWPGIIDRFRAAGFAVAAPDRMRRAPSWDVEAEHLAGVLPAGPITVVAGSNGCSAAVALALSRPVLVEKLVLAWPATAGAPDVDTRAAEAMAALGADPATVDAMLGGETLRGFTDDQLAALTVPVAVVPSIPENTFHRRRTVDALLRAVPDVTELPGTPEPADPDFSPHLGGFVSSVARFAAEA